MICSIWSGAELERVVGKKGLGGWAMAEGAGEDGYDGGYGTNIWNNSRSDPTVLNDAAGIEVDRW